MSSQIESADLVMVDSGSDYSLFDEAIAAVQANVLEEHRRYFHSQTNASLFLDELRITSASNGTSNRRLAECCRTFGLFSRNFAPYFDILSICVHIRPEWVGYFWGTVRLVFKASSDFPILLEKIADMLEAVAHILPPYQQICETCEQRNTFSLQACTEDTRLPALLSYAYADLIQLFLDLYRVFCRGSQGPRLRHLTFDSTHSAQWRPLDSRFSRLEARLTHHRRWLEKETENQIQNYDEIAQHRNRYFTFLNRQHDVNANNGGGLGDQRLAKRLRRVEKIKLWLSSGPSSVEVPNSNSRQQSLSSCAWFFETPAYLKWKNGSFEKSKANDKNDLEDTWQHRVLFVQAKPGFGKTFIWNTVIDQLSTEAEDPDISDEPPSTAFFQVHNRPEGGNPDGPFRALACQLIQTHRHNHSTLDAVCLLMRKTSFRENATTDEMLDVLSLLLRQHPTYLAIDGIDGCSDVEAFLASLAGLCRRSDAKVIVFSRPNIKIPLEYQKWASDAPHILPLTIEHNASAIEHFVAQDLNRMADQGFFGISMDRTSMPQVARIARGEFLWASILLKFLRSTALSSDERRAILENIQSLEGLESLYRNILSVLERRSKQEKRIIADVFRWLSFPINQLSPSALRAALSTFDIGEFEELCLADVLDILPELSCGLIDVHDMNITFAHESIREYLQTHLSSQNPCFSLYDEASVHAHLASRCLSYLAHDVPKRPLGGLSPRIRPTLPTVPTDSGVSLRTSKSGDSGYKSRSSSDGGNHLLQPIVHHHSNDTNTHSIRVIPFDTNLPFLRYAALCWPIHLSRALTDWNAHARVPTPHEPYATVPYLPALSAFLTSRLAVAAWVEASFRYNLPPTLTRLVGPLSDMKGEIPPATVEGKELRLVVNELRELSERLVELKREHVEIMGDNPSLIWQIDGDNYWPVWDDIREE